MKGIGIMERDSSSAPALARLVARMAADASWRPLVRYDAEQRVYVRLVWRPQYEVWLLCWAPGQEVALHDHGGASGAFVVTRGSLREAYVSGVALRRRVCVPGVVRRVPPERIHTVWNPGPQPAVSLHAYAPPLTTMTFYAPPAAQKAPRPMRAELAGEGLR